MSYTNYKDIVINKLAGLVGENPPNLLFVDVAGYEKEPDGYPIAYVIEETGKGSILDTHRNEREWQFNIVIHQEIGNKTQEEAYIALLDAVDRVIKSFDEDPMLMDVNNQAQCKWVRVVPVSFEFAQGQTQIHRALLTIAIVNIVNRYVA